MPVRDLLGFSLTGASGNSVGHYARAVHQLQCFIGDPVASIDAAIAADPGFVMAHVFKGYLFGLATEREATAVASNATRRAAACPARCASRRMSRPLAHSPGAAGIRPGAFSRS